MQLSTSASTASGWSDIVACSILFVLLAVTVVLLYCVGLPLLIIGGGLFVLRPPKYRDPLPTPPEAFFGRLPIAISHNREVWIGGREWLLGSRLVIIGVR